MTFVTTAPIENALKCKINKAILKFCLHFGFGVLLVSTSDFYDKGWNSVNSHWDRIRRRGEMPSTETTCDILRTTPSGTVAAGGCGAFDDNITPQHGNPPKTPE